MGRQEAKLSGDMALNRFDKKVCQVHEQFKLFLLAVAETIFGTEYESFSSPMVGSMREKFAGFEVVDTNSPPPKKPKQTGLKSSFGGKFTESFVDGSHHKFVSDRALPSTKRTDQTLQQETITQVNEMLPEASHAQWLKGVVWRGVYFRLLGRAESQIMRENIRAVGDAVADLVREDQGSTQRLEGVEFLQPGLMVLLELGAYSLFATPVVRKNQISRANSAVHWLPLLGEALADSRLAYYSPLSNSVLSQPASLAILMHANFITFHFELIQISHGNNAGTSRFKLLKTTDLQTAFSECFGPVDESDLSRFLTCLDQNPSSPMSNKSSLASTSSHLQAHS